MGRMSDFAHPRMRINLDIRKTSALKTRMRMRMSKKCGTSADADADADIRPIPNAGLR